MKVFAEYALMTFALTLATAGRAADKVQVFAQVDTSRDIYVGEAFTYRIIIDGKDVPGQVDLTPLAKFRPQDAGGGNASQTSVTIINSRTTTNVVKRYIMNYVLTAEQPGQVVLPGVTVTVEAREYRTNPVRLNILKPGTTDQLALEVTLSEQQCYVGQPVVLAVKFYRYANIADYQFNIPALTGDAFYIEDLDAAGGQAREYRVTHQNRDAILLAFSKVLIPKHAGNIDLGTASVSAAVAVGRVRSRDSFFDDFSIFGSRTQYQRFVVSSKPLKLAVLPLPEQGRPEIFSGLVGRYTISASATPTKVNIGDPITLTIRIGGSEYLKPVQWPELEQISELANNFKIPSQRASPTIENGYKVFTQTIRPTHEKASEIPSIPLTFFDPDQGRYATARTDPIRLEIAPTKILTDADLEGKDFMPVNKEVEAIKKGLSANYYGPEALINQTFSPLTAMVSPGYVVLWLPPLVGLIISALVKLFTHTSPEKLAQKRKRQAKSKALKQLKAVLTAEPRQSHELLVATMKQYLGERFDKVAGSLTADDCHQIIVWATEDRPAAEEYRDIITQCETSRYAAANVDVEASQIKQVAELVRRIERKAKA
jgi:hypothetical protein